MKLYAIRDLKANAFADPFHMPNDVIAARAVAAAKADSSTLLHKFPEDYQLWCLGDYNTETGQISEASVLICNITSLEA